MAYRFRKSDASTERAVRRIALEQIDRAIASIDGVELAEAVHDARKRCKKLRGLLRLVRPVFSEYAGANAEFRDIARLLSGARDAQVMQDTLDLLVGQYADEVEPFVLASIREALTALSGSQAAAFDPVEPLAQSRIRFVEIRRCAEEWHLEADGWPALGGGLVRIYRRARRAVGTARKEPGTATYHEMRKQLKYHWYHTRLLVGLWPEVMAVRDRTGRQVSELLGEHHDLCVFEERIAQYRDAFANRHEADKILLLAARRKQELEDQVWPLIGRLLAQSPMGLEQYWGGLWSVWQADDLASVQAG